MADAAPGVSGADSLEWGACETRLPLIISPYFGLQLACAERPGQFLRALRKDVLCV
jgi:hypothetical protein